MDQWTCSKPDAASAHEFDNTSDMWAAWGCVHLPSRRQLRAAEQCHIDSSGRLPPLLCHRSAAAICGPPPKHPLQKDALGLPSRPPPRVLVAHTYQSQALVTAAPPSHEPLCRPASSLTDHTQMVHSSTFSHRLLGSKLR